MDAPIIERNTSELGKKFFSNVKYVDIDYRGFIDDSTPPTITAGAVLVNNLKLWLQSSLGDYYRRVKTGGFFDNNLQAYPLNDQGADSLKAALTAAIQSQFTGIQILGLQISPDLDSRGWKIKLIVQDMITGILASFNTGIAL